MTDFVIEEIKGDTWDGATFTVKDKDTGAAIDLTGASITMAVRSAPDSEVVVLTLAVGTGITLTDPAAGQFALDPVVWSLAVGQYVFAIRITLASGRKKTWVKGSITISLDPNRA